MAYDVKKAFGELYAPGRSPHIIQVPPLRFMAVAGQGDPNEPQGAYAQALTQLYAVIYTIKMSKMGSRAIAGYEDFVVPPLEGLWWMPGLKGVDYAHKEKFHWMAMLRLPDFVDAEVLDWARAQVLSKKGIDASAVQAFDYDEGACVQCLHRGPYDDEPATLARMLEHMHEAGYESDFRSRHHHELYLSDPRKTAPDKLRTILRHPVRLAKEEG